MCVEGKVVVDRWVGEGKKKDRKLGKSNPPNHVLHFCVVESGKSIYQLNFEPLFK